MTDAEREYMHARRRVMDAHVNPIQDLLERSLAVVNDYKRERDEARAVLEQLRPVWAHDVTQQTLSVALGQVWNLLGATNQTQAMQRLSHLRSLVPPNVEWDDPLPSLEERARGTWHPGDEA